MGQTLNPSVVTDGLVFNLDTLGGREGDTIITKPTQVAPEDLVLWLDAADESTVTGSGTDVYTWNDKSGNGNDAFNHGSEYPQYDGTTINGRKVVHFVATGNASGDVLKGAFASGSQPFSGPTGGTVIIVFKQKSFVGTEFAAVLELAEGAYASSSYGDRLITNVFGSAYNSADGYVNAVRMASGAGDTNYIARIENGAPVIMSYTNDGTTTKTYANSDQVGTASEDEADNARTHFCLGDDMTSGDHFNGYICEVIIYNKTLSDTERQKVELYLSRKWNIILRSAARRQSVPNNVYSSQVPVTGFKYGKLDMVAGNYINFLGGPNTTGGFKDYIHLGDYTLGRGGTYSSGDPFTYEVWACSKSPTRDGSNWKTILGGSNLVQLHFYGASTVQFRKNGGNPGGDNKCQASIQLHQWYHIVGTYAGGTNQFFSGDISTGPDLRKLYIDGELADSDKECVRADNTANYIGSYHANGLERGPMELAVARIYDRELSHAEVKKNYNAQKARIAAIPKVPSPENIDLYLDAGLWESYKGYGSGTTWVDLSGNSKNGTLTNMLDNDYTDTLPDNDMGKFFTFDGSNDYINVTTIDLSTRPYITLAVWFKTNASGSVNYAMLMVGNSNNDGGAALSINASNQLYAFYRDEAYSSGSYPTVTGTTNVADGAWHFAVFTYDSVGASLYVDGVKEASTTRGSTMTDLTSELVYIGHLTNHSDGNHHFNGFISVAMMWKTGLSAKQVKQLYDYFKHRYGK